MDAGCPNMFYLYMYFSNSANIQSLKVQSSEWFHSGVELCPHRGYGKKIGDKQRHDDHGIPYKYAIFRMESACI